jgi:flagellar hook-associated protein 3 FlgL
VRISSNWLALRMLGQVQRAQSRMVDEQRQVATGKRINSASDDPVGVGRLLGLLTRGANNEQYQRNVAVAGQDLAATEAALASMHELLARAHELSVQASNDSLGAGDRAKIALEVSELIAQAVNVSNRQHGDRYLFSGHRTNVKPFTEDVPGSPSTVTYSGDAGLIAREIAQGERVDANINGTQFFPAAFARLIQLRDALNADDRTTVRNATGTLKASMDEGLTIRSDIGARVLRVESAGQRHEDEHVLVESMRSGIEDADLAEAIVRLEAQETTYQAALASTARVSQISLLDFLR